MSRRDPLTYERLPSGLFCTQGLFEYRVPTMGRLPHILLQCVVVCCSVPHCVAVCCNLLQCVAVCCSVLQFVAVCRLPPLTARGLLQGSSAQEIFLYMYIGCQQ